jgi:lipoprotein-anchoring transpeptidase ErfK/SrfK
VLTQLTNRPQPPHPHRVGRFGRVLTVGALALAVLSTAACGSDKKVPVNASVPVTSDAATAGASASAVPAPVKAKADKLKKAADAKPDKRSSAQTIAVGDVSVVARTTGASIKIYPSAGSTSPKWTLKNPLPSGAPLVFLVLDRTGDWLHVLVPVRPNESQGWVRASDVTVAQHDYRIAVSAGKHTLTLYQAGKVALQVPVGLGTGSTPTPGGVFYTKELLRPPNPNGAYGPYAYGLSGYSTVLENFGGGDGELGIHGTNDPASVGKNVSHGCIRMSNANITKLAGMLPLGVPVQIVR